MNMENENKINEAYDKMLKSADSIAESGITGESIDTLETIKKDVEEILDGNTNSLLESEPTNYVNIDATTPCLDGETVMTSYNPTTGDQVVVDGSNDIAEKIANIHLDNLINGVESTSDAVINEVLKEVCKKDDSLSSLSSLITKRLSGEDFDAYAEMPDDYKKQVDMLYAESAAQVGANRRAGSMMYSKKAIANMIIDDIINDVKKHANSQIDLDTILSGFDKDIEKMNNDLSSELGGMMMSFDEERKAEIDAAIKRCEESGKTEAIDNLKAMRDTIDDAFNLEKFIEFCKNCKIRNIEAKEPEKRVFSYFNSKYDKHKFTINDIRSCPTILDRHLTEYSHLQNTILCIAFCKYCQNMTPNNMNEHTFMYYFIRNIIAIDRLNPKGRLYEGMDERSKAFYDSFVSALRKAMENLLIRNPKFNEKDQ